MLSRVRKKGGAGAYNVKAGVQMSTADAIEDIDDNINPNAFDPDAQVSTTLPLGTLTGALENALFAKEPSAIQSEPG